MGRKAKILLAALIATPAGAQDYEPVLIPPQLFGSPQTMIATNLGDDNTRLVQLGFPFEYYGNVYTSAWLSSNGFVSFQGPNHLCCNGFPMEQAQRNTIYAYWTDLISGGNPYYLLSEDSALFGWYNTNEFGTQNKNTFEINLSANGNIQINYGAVANTYHYVAAGLTGPTSSDNIQLFYGTNVSSLSFQSGLLSPAAPALSPVAAPTPEPTPAPNPLAITIPAQEEQIVAAKAAVDEAITAAEEVGVDVTDPTPAEEVAAEQSATEAVAEEAVQEDDSMAEDANDPPPPPGLLPGSAPPPGSESTIMVSGTRRDRNVEFFQSEAVEEADLFARETVIQASLQNVAFVAQADAQYAAQYGEQTTTETAGITYTIQPTDGPTFLPVVTTTIGDTTTPSGQAQQMELLGMQNDMAAGKAIDVGDVNTSDGETMAQLGAVPAGYSAYTQARIPDAPFYQPRDIYKGRRIPDANMALYRMMSGQDARWQEMVDEQYE